MEEWTPAELQAIEQIERMEAEEARKGQAASARMQSIANKATSGIPSLMNQPLPPKNPMAEQVAAKSTQEIPGLMSGEVAPIGAPAEDPGQSWFRESRPTPSMSEYLDVGGQAARRGIREVGFALDNIGIGQEDPVIVQYAKDHDLDLGVAKEILRKRGYGK